MNSKFRIRVAETPEDIKNCFELSIELMRLIEGKNIDPKISERVVNYYMTHKDISLMFMAEEISTGLVVAFFVSNQVFSMELNCMTHRPLTLIVRKGYRQQNLASAVSKFAHEYTQSWNMKYFWGYFVTRNNRASNIYDGWGLHSHYHRAIFFMDLELRKDPVSKQNLTYTRNLQFFLERFAKSKFSKNKNVYSVSQVTKQDLKEIEKVAPKLKNIHNSVFETVSIEGMQKIVDGMFNTECLVIKKQGKVFAVCGIMKYYFLGRNGYDLWLTGLYADLDSDLDNENTWIELYLSLQNYYLEKMCHQLDKFKKGGCDYFIKRLIFLFLIYDLIFKIYSRMFISYFIY